ncbi:MAG: type II toxin-antitoxin system PemK/MazF family toxin [Limnothrix sp. CACIAM 69d]|nr:MAG: type II toxin-antitoxin system PemK/MazF family toxin [Limnothrix sp. CACIAM 69d]
MQAVIIAPLTTKFRDDPTRIPCSFENKSAQVVLDQIRTVDRQQLVKSLRRIDRKTQRRILETLQMMFSE